LEILAQGTTMPSSSKEDGTAAAAQQLGSMSLGGSAVERNDEDNDAGEPTAKNGATPTTKKLCSACGKKSDTLKKCNGCKCAWYCDKKCQNKHRKEHKRECRPIKEVLDKRGGRLVVGTEKDLGPLGKVPPREECPICMRALPIHARLHVYAACCGKFICGGCNFQYQIKSTEVNAKRGQREPPLPLLPRLCAFCRTAAPPSNEELLVQLRKRVELKDPNALYNMAVEYGNGQLGLSVDQAKCIDLMRQSSGLGCTEAQLKLGSFYDSGMMGLEQNEEEAFKYEKKAAEGGQLNALYNVGCFEAKNGDLVAAMRHWRLAASGGYKNSMQGLIAFYFENGLIHHGDLAETLQAMYLARGEMRSEDRDQYIKHLKMTGEYREEYEH